MGRKKYEHDKVVVRGKSNTNWEKGKVIPCDVLGGGKYCFRLLYLLK